MNSQPQRSTDSANTPSNQPHMHTSSLHEPTTERSLPPFTPMHSRSGIFLGRTQSDSIHSAIEHHLRRSHILEDKPFQDSLWGYRKIVCVRVGPAFQGLCRVFCTRISRPEGRDNHAHLASSEAGKKIKSKRSYQVPPATS